MVTLVKHEWHSHDRQYAYELDVELLSEIYPDATDDELEQMMEKIESGIIDVDTIVADAYDNAVDIEWEFQYDDCWTDRKGGYEVTYEVGDDDSWHSETPPPEPTHKCINCKWVGQSYDADWQWPEDDETGEKEAKKVCPMCDSDTELTEAGIKEEQEKQERTDRWKKEEELEELKHEFDQLTIEEPNPTAAWPFSNNISTEITEENLLPNSPAGEYTIRIWGRTREIGVGNITKAQYDYWSSEEREDALSDALNESYDYDENETPPDARFQYPYYEYQDVESIWGFEFDDTHMTIEDSEGNEIYEGDLESFISEAHGDNDSQWDATEETGELYPESFTPGHYVYWTQGGKGSCIQTTIVTEGEEFDPRKLKVKTIDVQGSTLACTLEYDGVELDDEGMDVEHDNWRGQWSSFSVHESL